MKKYYFPYAVLFAIGVLVCVVAVIDLLNVDKIYKTHDNFTIFVSCCQIITGVICIKYSEIKLSE